MALWTLSRLGHVEITRYPRKRFLRFDDTMHEDMERINLVGSVLIVGD